jgi:hypothetical protein
VQSTGVFLRRANACGNLLNAVKVQSKLEICFTECSDENGFRFIHEFEKYSALCDCLPAVVLEHGGVRGSGHL